MRGFTRPVPTRPRPRADLGRRHQHASARDLLPATAYSRTVDRLLVGPHTRVMYQGFTGRQATANAAASIAWGTNVVGGVSPGRTGTHDGLGGLPVLPSVREARNALQPDATAIFVAAHQTAAAIEEAVEAEIGLVVAVAEHVPLHHMLRVHSLLRTQSASRLVGANSPGIIAPPAHCRVGFQPLGVFSPGRVGIAAKSGTLSYEAAASTTRAGLGQSLCVGIGGDILAGTDMCEALAVLLDDPATDAIALIGEVGGTAEMDAAELIAAYRRSTAPGRQKPIVAVLGGLGVSGGRVVGHAGAFADSEYEMARYKRKNLVEAGVIMVAHPSEFGDAISRELRGDAALPPRQPHGEEDSAMAAGDFFWIKGPDPAAGPADSTDKVREMAQRALLRRPGLSIRWADPAPSSGDATPTSITAGIDRSRRQPFVVFGDGDRTPLDGDVNAAFERMRVRHARPADARTARAPEPAAVQALAQAAGELLRDGDLAAYRVRLDLDPAALAAGRLEVTAATTSAVPVVLAAGRKPTPPSPTPPPAGQDPLEMEAAAHDMTYLPLATDARRCIGVLSNGAGLAMNMIDALCARAGAGVGVANFLDTGGKANSEAMARCLGWVLSDPRVRVVFVNIFGGIIRGDVMARGIVDALQQRREQQQQQQHEGEGEGEGEVRFAPLVVRIRGTNEAEGQKLLAESGLDGLFVFDDFDEAAAKAVELARGS